MAGFQLESLTSKEIHRQIICWAFCKSARTRTHTHANVHTHICVNVYGNGRAQTCRPLSRHGWGEFGTEITLERNAERTTNLSRRQMFVYANNCTHSIGGHPHIVHKYCWSTSHRKKKPGEKVNTHITKPSRTC